MSAPSTTFAEVVKRGRGRPKLSDEEKAKRRAEKKPIGRPKGSTKPEHLKARSKSPTGYKNNGRKPGFSGWEYNFNWAEGRTPEAHPQTKFQTMQEIADYFGYSIGRIRRLREYGWDLDNAPGSYPRDFKETFEDLESVDHVCVSQKFHAQRQKEWVEDKEKDEAEEARWIERFKQMRDNPENSDDERVGALIMEKIEN
tara:strand:- start:652 stop:1248 length:597 start_codon:yes stop_codon:yes gene_type:complete